MNRHSTSRREFLKQSTLAIGAAGFLKPSGLFAADAKSTVALIRNERAIDDQNKVDRMEAAAMIAAGLVSLTGKTDRGEAWTALGLTRDDVVGIKVNTNSAGFLLGAHPDLVTALCDSLQSVVKANSIIIYDRDTAELTRTGFTENTSATGVRCFGTEKAGFSNGEELTDLVASHCSKLINLPSLKTFEQEFAGTLGLKNHIGSLRRADMSRCHGNAPFISEVNARPSIKDKTMLVLCDGLRGTYRRNMPWYWKGIVMGKDPVAVEVSCLAVINQKRAEENVPAMDIPEYVRLADTQYHLGASDPSRIDQISRTI